MKVAIAADGGYVAQHFGKCQEYAVFEVENGSSGNLEYIPSPGHQPGFLPRYLKSLNVDCIIAGGMGQKALALFAENNIETIVGISGPVEKVKEDFVNGKLVSGASLCTHPDGHHEGCGGHC
jgi:predicted Fe-Mo cluster-binding NifX family protein